MAKGNFPACHAITAKWEGGWSDHAADPGGATKYGITIATLSRWRGRQVTKQEVRDLTREEAERIYRKWYWDEVRGDDLPFGVDLVTYDSGVNSGPARGARWTQAALGVAADGRIGPVTIAAARKAKASVTIQRATDVRLRFLQGLSTWAVFGKGWGRRVGDIRARALAMAGSSTDAIRHDAIRLDGEADTDTGHAKTTGTGGAAAGGTGVAADQVAQVDWTVIAGFGVVAVLLIALAIFLSLRARARREAAAAMAAVAAQNTTKG